MRSLFPYIWLLLCGLIPSSIWAQSAHEPHFSSPSSEFYAKTLSFAQLNTFQKRAVQKIQDFGSGLHILSQSQFALPVRKNTQAAVLSQFDNEKTTIKSFSLFAAPPQLSITQFLQRLMDSPISNAKIEVSDIQLIAPFSKQTKNTYIATFRFILKSNQTPALIETRIILKQVQKNFGTQTREVWEVFLGDMEEIK